MSFDVNLVGITGDRAVGGVVSETTELNLFLQELSYDLDHVFFATDEEGNQPIEFSTFMQYTHTTGEILDRIPCHFDDPQTAMSFKSEAEFNTIKPHVRFNQAKLKRVVKKNDRVRVNGQVYYAEEHHSDGVGVMTIYLRRK